MTYYKDSKNLTADTNCLVGDAQSFLWDGGAEKLHGDQQTSQFLGLDRRSNIEVGQK